MLIAIRLVTKRAKIAGLASLVLAAAGCETKPQTQPGAHPVVAVAPPAKSAAWRRLATDADEDRIGRLSSAWQQALTEAGKSFGNDIRKDGPLLKPSAALPRPSPTPGSYNCRLIKLGQATPKTRAYETFKPFFCYVEVEGDLLTIVKQTGSQRPAGRLWQDDDPNRLIFLGSLALGDEEQPLAYGDDAKRNMAGGFERVGPFRWRLVIPWPQSTSKLDVFELTPVADQPQG